MTRLFFFLLLLILFSIAAMWFVENDGSIIVEWMGYRIQTSVAFAALASVVVIVISAMILQLLFWIREYPSRFRKELAEKRRDNGLTALTEGFAAVAAGDTKQARRLTKRATQNLGPIPLTRLLSAQTAQLEGNREQARIHYTAMLENKETEMIAIKGLLIQARDEGDLHKAIFLAEKALAIRQDADWAMSILMDLYKRTRQWIKAEEIMERAVKKKFIMPEDSKRSLALLALAQSTECLHRGDSETAFKLLHKAYRNLPDFVPIITAYADALLRNGDERKSFKILESGWRVNSHPEIAKRYLQHFAEESSEKLLHRAERLYKLKPDHFESHMIMARCALAAHQLVKARNHIKMALGMAETQSACRLMAEVERLDNANSMLVTQWENRASVAPEDPSWTCKHCGHCDANWHIQCPRCESFDSLRWGGGHEFTPPAPATIELLTANAPPAAQW